VATSTVFDMPCCHDDATTIGTWMRHSIWGITCKILLVTDRDLEVVWRAYCTLLGDVIYGSRDQIAKLRDFPSRHSDWELVHDDLCFLTIASRFVLPGWALLYFESSHMIELRRTPSIENKAVICLLLSRACSWFLKRGHSLCPLFFFSFSGKS
jgi:hypothetical protein